MKAKLSFLMITTIVVMVMTACSKKDDLTKPTTTTHLKTTQNTMWHDNGKHPGVEGVDYGCWGWPSNCGSETTIGSGGPIYGPVQGFLGNVALGDPEDIIASLQENYDYLSQIMDTHYLEGIIDGTFTVEIRGGTGLTTEHPVYLVIKRGTTVEIVFPLTVS